METRKLTQNRCVTVCMGSDCKDRGAKKLYKDLEKALKARKLTGRVRIAACKCVGDCGKGPHVISYPEGPWYRDVSRGDTEDIAEALAAPKKSQP